jgi:hypothetical protein
MKEDNLTLPGATELAERIKDYWNDRGRRVLCNIESVPYAQKKVVYTVRSNMINGSPR